MTFIGTSINSLDIDGANEPSYDDDVVYLWDVVTISDHLAKVAYLHCSSSQLRVSSLCLAHTPSRGTEDRIANRAFHSP